MKDPARQVLRLRSMYAEHEADGLVFHQVDDGLELVETPFVKDHLEKVTNEDQRRSVAVFMLCFSLLIRSHRFRFLSSFFFDFAVYAYRPDVPRHRTRSHGRDWRILHFADRHQTLAGDVQALVNDILLSRLIGAPEPSCCVVSPLHAPGCRASVAIFVGGVVSG